MPSQSSIYAASGLHSGPGRSMHVTTGVVGGLIEEFLGAALPRFIQCFKSILSCQTNPRLHKLSPPRIQDGTTKMSKSADSDFSRINLLDDPDLIRKKIQRAKTDSFQGLSLGDPNRPESSNLLTIYQAVTGLSQVVCAHIVKNKEGCLL